ncbi:MAG: alpha/beta hydrolase [Dysgonomonas sp.]|uniref:alpha/beta hydrolase n=1 Tax=Dysgonomonas sp. TaxID=1891233 RepID=UPI0039E7049B
MKKIIAIMAAIILAGTDIASAQKIMAEDLNKRTFSVNENVISEKVHFYNRFGIQIVGDMYLSKNINRQQKYAAIIVGHPYGGVKEQSSGLYAQELAERGFVTIAIDLSYNGESGGQPRHISTPEGYIEDFMATVDFIGTRPFVDKEHIGIIGICGSGGFAISAASIDPRMKAVATVSMYDMGRATRQGLNDVITEEQRQETLKQIAEQRWAEYEGSPVEYRYGTPPSVDEDTHPVSREFFEYYRMPRGSHPGATTAMSITSNPALMNFFPFQMIETVSPRPLLFIAGENAHSRYFSEDAYKLAAEPKELYIVPKAGHVDLYDKTELIPMGMNTRCPR